MAPPAQTESSTHWSDSLPAYEKTGSAEYADEKAGSPPSVAILPAHRVPTDASTSGPCSQHGPSQTPHLDAQLRQPKTQAALRSLIATLTDAVDGHRCTECTIEATAHTLTAYVTEMKASKKSGQWSKEDKKALKAEAKAVGKRVKGSVKMAYRSKA